MDNIHTVSVRMPIDFYQVMKNEAEEEGRSLSKHIFITLSRPRKNELKTGTANGLNVSGINEDNTVGA